MGWDWLNLITSRRSFIFAIGVLLLVVNVIASLRSGAPAGANPWDAPTLEWAVPSPPPPYNFAVIPRRQSHPLWEDAAGRRPARAIPTRDCCSIRPRDDRHDRAGWRARYDPEDARGHLRPAVPGGRLVARLLRLAIAVLADQMWAAPACWLPSHLALARRPARADRGGGPWLMFRSAARPARRRRRHKRRRLVGGAVPDRLRGVALRLSAVQLLLLRAQNDRSLDAGRASVPDAGAAQHDRPPAYSVAVWWGERGAKQGQLASAFPWPRDGHPARRRFRLRAAFEWRSKTFSLSSGLYGSLYFVITGFHMAHVVVGLLVLLAVLVGRCSAILIRGATRRC